MSDWMIDTFIYTTLLIGLVLVLRRPVTRYFGPQVAYALWALPLLRFIMPPIVLPAWMAPAEPIADAPATTAANTAEPLMVILSDAPAEAVAATVPEVGLTATDVLLPLWLGGAAIFLAWRIRDYIRMRRDLLAEARPMGESGNIRLVETPAVSAPVAFGIRDKVVALPIDFMALLDVNARDMAIAHELEHHRGHDLLANIAAQPLLALHWFNPLAWWGWRAMRRDQEAACDARVVAGRARSERAAYAEVIAGFAAGEHLALAAPMACPVLGEKSIIHRLRSLTMNDISSSRRRIGIAAITTTALALPLTASISYAAPDTTSEAALQDMETVDPDTVEEEEVWVEEDSDADVDVWVDEDGERRVEVRVIRSGEESEDGERRVVRRVVTRNIDGDSEISEEELAEIMAEVREELAGLDGEIERSIELAMAASDEAMELNGRRMVFVGEDSTSFSFECDGDDPVVERELEDGRTATIICRTQLRMHAADGLQQARDAIASNPEIPEDMREDLLRELEEAEENLRAREVSFFAPKAPRSVIAPRVPSDAASMRMSVRFNMGLTGRSARAQPAPAPSVAPALHIEPEDCPEATRA